MGYFPIQIRQSSTEVRWRLKVRFIEAFTKDEHVSSVWFADNDLALGEIGTHTGLFPMDFKSGASGITWSYQTRRTNT